MSALAESSSLAWPLVPFELDPNVCSKRTVYHVRARRILPGNKLEMPQMPPEGERKQCRQIKC